TSSSTAGSRPAGTRRRRTLRAQPRMQLRPLRHLAPDVRVVLLLGREDVFGRHGLGATKPSSDVLTLKSAFRPSALPTVRGGLAPAGDIAGEVADVGREIAQGLLAALDRVVLLH